MEEMVEPFLPFLIYTLYLRSRKLMCNPLKTVMTMKRIIMLFMFCGLMLTALADWSYGTAYFQGSQPSSCLNHGGVMIWYNGDLRQTSLQGGVEIWEGTGDICVAYPKNYNGPKMRFLSKGGSVQIQFQK